MTKTCQDFPSCPTRKLCNHQGWPKPQSIRYKNLKQVCSPNRADQLHGYHMQLICFCFSCICKKVFFMVRLICFSIHVHILFNCLLIIGNPSYFCLCMLFFYDYKMALQFKMRVLASMINVPVICIHCSCPPPSPPQRGKGRIAGLRCRAITFLLSTQCRGRAGF